MNTTKLYNTIIYLNPKIKFESFLKFLGEDMLEQELITILLETRRNLFYKGNWDKDREDMVKNTLSNSKHYNAYNKVNQCSYPADFNFFVSFLK